MQAYFDTLSSYPILLYVSVAGFALLFGSFFNVVIHRLPKMLEQDWINQSREFLQPENERAHAATDEENNRISLAFPPSSCPQCNHQIRPWENIPVISYLFLRGKCSSCRSQISLRYPIIEVVTAVFAVVVIQHFGLNWVGLSALAFSWFLLVLAAIDFDTQLLPDNLTLPLLWLGLLVNIPGWFTGLENAVWGAVLGYLSLWSVYHLFKLLTGKEGMGYGDFKLLAAIGAWLGWQKALLTILLSSFVGAIVGLALIVLLGRDRNIPIPFGPYLAVAGWIALMWGDRLISLYLDSQTGF